MDLPTDYKDARQSQMIILVTCLDKERRLSNWSSLQMKYSTVLGRCPEGNIVPLKTPSTYRRKTDYYNSLYAVVIPRLNKWRIEIAKYSDLWSRSLCKPFSDHVVPCVDTLLFIPFCPEWLLKVWALSSLICLSTWDIKRMFLKVFQL